MTGPGSAATRVPPGEFDRIRRRLMFEACRWDPQNGDQSAIAPVVWSLPPAVWKEVAELAERLARETRDAEEELRLRPALHAKLGLSRAVRHALSNASTHPSLGMARVIRFDFHWTRAGWRISEANTDVPGGFIEATALTQLVASSVNGAPVGDPTAVIARSVQQTCGACGTVALVHATAHLDDTQVMRFVAQAIERTGMRAVLAAPDHLSWRGGRAFMETEWYRGPLDGLIRFFPAEWLPGLPSGCGWRHWFSGSFTPLSNPATSILTQSKRFPLVWDDMESPLALWREILPETRDPRGVAWTEDPGWVAKPALGRVGDGVGIREAVPDKEWRQIVREVGRHPEEWAVQRRFDPVPMETPLGLRFACLGVFTVDGRAAGVYGRLAARPRIDEEAQDVAVLMESE